ncbi:adenylate/guanylate cyclase domain-containing protein [Roseivirga echinicomitans]
MAELILNSDKLTIDCESGQTILDASLKKGIPHAHACGGKAVCSTCRVYIDEGLENVNPRNEKEQKLADSLNFGPEIRLACQTTIYGPVKARRLVLDKIDERIILSEGKSNKPRSLGEVIDASVMFVDIADFTAFSERTPAYDVVHVLNRYFYIAGNIIKKHNGRIVDYYGDGFLAIFGLDHQPNHTKNVVSAGFELQKAIKDFDHEVHDLVNTSFKIRLGAHTGKVIWGSIGIEGMRKEAAIGDTVNFASRIEQANKVLNTDFLISEALFKKFESCCVTNAEYEIDVKGKTGVYKVYSLEYVSPSVLAETV